MNENILIFIAVGFVAQLVDGALGMAYGVISNSFLLNFGLPPALASASVHFSEMFTSGVSGFSHIKLKNIDKKIFEKLLVPGILGGIAGAYLLTRIPGDKIKPYVALYLLLMGVVIVLKAAQGNMKKEIKNRLLPLGLIGGFFDAVGGGGWGPIVTSTLVAKGNHPRFVIGSVNLAEFFVTLAQSITFFIFLGSIKWEAVAGLVIGGVIAAPLGAFASKKIPARTLMILVGALIIILSLRTVYLSL